MNPVQHNAPPWPQEEFPKINHAASVRVGLAEDSPRHGPNLEMAHCLWRDELQEAPELFQCDPPRSTAVHHHECTFQTFMHRPRKQQ